MKVFNISVSEPGVSEQNPYIYILYTTLPESFVYVGETEERNGALGRLAGHLKIESQGTFIKKYTQYSIYDIDSIKNIKMIAFNVSEYEIFSGDINKTKRRALEYLLHFELTKYASSDEVKKPYDAISHVQAQQRYIEDKTIVSISKQLFNEARNLLPFNKGEI